MFSTVVILVATLFCYRLHIALMRRPRLRPKGSAPTCSLAVFLGSGGHTSEALQMLSALDFGRYTPRRYIISEGDHLSAEKAAAFERTKSSPESVKTGDRYLITTIPRARFLGLPSPRVIYVESFARVNSLSISARLLRLLVDRFVVQWPQLLQNQKAGEYVGCVI
ncbi:UDP-N-acetylglucosamine transferase subunit ALG14 [Leucoagaricus sp. SymC.cos]|nr:UDP-N-acetylglucosamine transferase subunit ALG14 [Leucoagaricus sp. SymC.cos]